MLPSIAFARLWENIWSSNGGDALQPADIEAAFVNGLQPMTGNESGYLFVAGCDLGLTRDCSAVVVLGVPSGGGAGRIRLAHHKLWRPTPGKKIALTEVEKHILGLDRQFGLEQVAIDPWQAELLGQRLEADTGHRRRNQRRRSWAKPWVQSMPPTGPTLRDQCSLTIECFQDRRFLFYDCPALKRDLLKLRVEQRQYGLRLTSPRDGDGHGDLASAFNLALLVSVDLAAKRRVRAGIVDLRPPLPFKTTARMTDENEPLFRLMKKLGRVRKLNYNKP